MRIKIPINKLPYLASRTYWADALGMSVSAIDRAEKAGLLEPGFRRNERSKIYTKEQIFKWLGTPWRASQRQTSALASLKLNSAPSPASSDCGVQNGL